MIKRILYMTDKLGVSKGYEAAFSKLLQGVGIRRLQVIPSSIYPLVESPLYRKGNEKLFRFNPTKLDEIKRALDQRIKSIKPSVIVVSCPAVIGVIVGGDERLGTIDKTRGGVYEYDGIPVIITLPISAINTNFREIAVEVDEGEESYEVYKVPNGYWILSRDWAKVSRVFNDRAIKHPPFEYVVCRSVEDCRKALSYAKECSVIAPDIETGLYPAQMTCVGFSGLHKSGHLRQYVFPFTDKTKESGCFWEEHDDHIEAWNLCEQVLKLEIPKLFFNGNYDCSYFIKYQMDCADYILDGMYMWYSLYMELPKSLDFVSSIMLDNFQYWKDDIKGEANESAAFNQELYWRYNALDCYNTILSGLYLWETISKDPEKLRNYQDVMMRNACALGMSMRGVRADFDKREEHRKNLTAEAEAALTRLRYLLDDDEFNPNSPAQKIDLLYGFLGAPMRNAAGKYVDKNKPLTHSNKPSSGARALKLTKSEHPLYEIIISALEDVMVPSKQISNVCNMKLFTDRFRTNFKAAGTETTRLASKGSNFWDGGNAQNIRKKYRDWMVADDGHIFMEIDYSQSDDVYVGYESQDLDKIKVIESGIDGHSLHGELFFKLPFDDIIKGKKAKEDWVIHPITGVRSLSKKIVHGTNFQMAGFTLYAQMGRDAVVAAAILLGFADAASWKQEKLVSLCEFLMKQYRLKYKRLNKKEWYADILRDITTTGKLTTCFGISRRFLGNPNDPGTQREATAFLGQGATAGNMNRSMYEIILGHMPWEFRDGLNPDRNCKPLQMDYKSHGCSLLLQVHDSFLFSLNMRHPKWKEAASNILHVMNRPCIIHGREVRVRTEAEFTYSWGSNKAVEWDGVDPFYLDTIAQQALATK